MAGDQQPNALRDVHLNVIRYARRMESHIKARFEFNLQRVEKLVEIYEAITALPKDLLGYRRDVLRAAVVMLHACLEDLLRESLALTLPGGQASRLGTVPFNAASGDKAAVTLAALASHRGKSVDDVIRVAVRAHLDRTSFNNVGDVANALKLLGVEKALVKPHLPALAAAIARCHDIVHQGDRKRANGKSHGKPRTIEEETVTTWVDAVRSLGAAVVVSLK